MTKPKQPKKSTVSAVDEKLKAQVGKAIDKSVFEGEESTLDSGQHTKTIDGGLLSHDR